MNFGLRIVGRRGDGYHELESVFLPLDWADRVEIEVEAAAGSEVALALVGAVPGALPPLMGWTAVSGAI